MALAPIAERVFQVASFADYVEYLVGCLEDFVLFRGQPQDKPLIPRIGRVTFRGDAFFLPSEQQLLESFKREAVSFMDRPPDNDWEWLALAQHYGLPTRLLDWTKNPLAALWFCVRAPSESKSPGVVWVCRGKPARSIVVVESNWWSGESARIFVPTHVTPRIRAQDGIFTVQPYTGEPTTFTPLEQDQEFSKLLEKIIVPAECFADLRFHLDRCGIHDSALFPDLAGLARRIEWQHTMLTDEREPFGGAALV